MIILLISAIISAVIVRIWYNRKEQAIYDEYQKQMQKYLNQLGEPQQQQTIEQYTMFFKVSDEQYKRFFNEGE